MNSENREIEVKLPVSSAEALIPRILELGGVCELPMQLERNLRFDTPKGELSENEQVLRLRASGERAILTFKSDRNSTDGLADREEIETDVSDFDKAQLILERLGYGVFFIYEKYRAIYSLDGTGIFVDHTPIGDFIEIEGPDEETIRHSAEKLGLDWSSRSGIGYKTLFNRWKEKSGFKGRDMTFRDIIEPEDHA